MRTAIKVIQTAICLLFFLQTLKRDYNGALARRGAPWVGKKMVAYRCEKFWQSTDLSVRPCVPPPPTTGHVSQPQMSYLLLTILKHGRSLGTWKMTIAWASSLSICSALWDDYAYFLPTYWSAVTFKRSYSDAN